MSIYQMMTLKIATELENLETTEKSMLFLNENFSEENNKIAFMSRKLKWEGMIANTYLVNGIICLSLQKKRPKGSSYKLFIWTFSRLWFWFGR